MTSPEILQSQADVWIDVEVEIDRTALTLRQILELSPNSLIRLSRLAGENADVFIGGAHVGQGEILVSDEAVTVRIAELREEE
ncbi:MAG TPA: FliM/FliN family flagellar motor C-terminal domain-containing protein [Bryobacteraceae bacterium]|nr:FliM/FliN family flagellar motor C-terminal domain-containing protein [Bryobacteraceae bacterium]